LDDRTDSSGTLVGLALGSDPKIRIQLESLLRPAGFDVVEGEDLPSLLLELGLAERKATALFFSWSGEEAETASLIRTFREAPHGEGARVFALSPEWGNLRLRMRSRVCGCDDLLRFPPEPGQIVQALGLESIPLSPAAPDAGPSLGEKAERAPEESSLPVLQGRVLVVDDASVIRVGLKQILEGIGLSVVEAENGAEGFNVAMATKPDLVVTVLLMPQLDGFSLMSRLRGAPPTTKTPIIVVSGYGDRPRLVKALRSGANDFIVKPFQPEIVKQKTRKLLAPSPVPAGGPAEGGEPR